MDEKATMGQSLRSTEDEETIDLMELARLLWAHAVQIVAAAVAAALICLLVCVFALTPKYQASINMIVNTRQDNSSTFTSDNFNSAKNLISTYAVIIKGNTVLNEVIDKLDLDMTYTELYDMVDVADVDATQIMKITVTDTDAERAGEIAQTIADIVSGGFDMEPVIRPVLDLSAVSAGADALNNLFYSQRTVGLVGQAAVAFEAQRGGSSQTTISVDNDDVVAELRTLRGEMASMLERMEKLRVVLNTGALVGELAEPMDVALGQRSTQRGRGI